MQNGKFNCADIVKICEKKATVQVIPKKHIKIRVMYEDMVIAQTEVPHGRKNLPRGTYKAIAKQLLLTVDQFDDFLGCTFSKDMYSQILKEKYFEKWPTT